MATSADKPEHDDFFQLQYPIQFRPSARIRDTTYRIVRLSEGGLTLACPDPQAFIPGARLALSIIFRDGEVAEIPAAFVVRVEEGKVVLKFHEGVTFNTMMKEQRRIIRHALVDGEPEYLDLLRKSK